MRNLLLFSLSFAILLAGCGNNEKPAETPAPERTSQHSREFNKTMDGYLDDYYRLSEALVKWDSSEVKVAAATLIKGTDNLALQSGLKDSAIAKQAEKRASGFHKHLSVMMNTGDLTTKRRAFDAYSEELFDFLNTIRYDHKKLYLQECPMAFEEGDKTGVWLSEVDSIRNPYMGLYHPKYKSGMLVCGENKSTIDIQNK